MKKQVILILFAALAAALLGLWVARTYLHQPPTPPAVKTANLYPQPLPLPRFQLIDQDDKPFTNRNLEGHWSFLFFGYTYCPDVCPMTLNEFKQVYTALDKSPGGVGNTQFVFVSVDPERDTPARLKEYVGYFNPDFLGVTGTPEALTRLTGAIGIAWAKVPAPDGGPDYLVDHSSAILLTDPQGRRYALFTARPPSDGQGIGGHDPKALTEDFLAIRKAVGH